jgi:hypothetical protein
MVRNLILSEIRSPSPITATPSSNLAAVVSTVVVAHLHDLILELGQEVVDNLILLDRERVEVDLLHALDLAGLDETAELGDGLPLLLLALAATATTTARATAAAAVTTTLTTTSSETATAGASSPISHCCDSRDSGGRRAIGDRV